MPQAISGPCSRDSRDSNTPNTGSSFGNMNANACFTANGGPSLTCTMLSADAPVYRDALSFYSGDDACADAAASTGQPLIARMKADPPDSITTVDLLGMRLTTCLPEDAADHIVELAGLGPVSIVRPSTPPTYSSTMVWECSWPAGFSASDLSAICPAMWSCPAYCKLGRSARAGCLW